MHCLLNRSSRSSLPRRLSKSSTDEEAKTNASQRNSNNGQTAVHLTDTYSQLREHSWNEGLNTDEVEQTNLSDQVQDIEEQRGNTHAEAKIYKEPESLIEDHSTQELLTHEVTPTEFKKTRRNTKYQPTVKSAKTLIHPPTHAKADRLLKDDKNKPVAWSHKENIAMMLSKYHRTMTEPLVLLPGSRPQSQSAQSALHRKHRGALKSAELHTPDFFEFEKQRRLGKLGTGG